MHDLRHSPNWIPGDSENAYGSEHLAGLPRESQVPLRSCQTADCCSNRGLQPSIHDRPHRPHCPLGWRWYVNCVNLIRGSNSTAGTGAHFQEGCRRLCGAATSSSLRYGDSEHSWGRYRCAAGSKLNEMEAGTCRRLDPIRTSADFPRARDDGSFGQCAGWPSSCRCSSWHFHGRRDIWSIGSPSC